MINNNQSIEVDEDDFLDMKSKEECIAIAQHCAHTLAVIAHTNGMKSMDIGIRGLTEQGIERGDWKITVQNVKPKYLVQ